MSWTMKTDPSGWNIRWSEELAARYRAEGHWRDNTLVDAARAAVAEDPSRILLIEGSQHSPAVKPGTRRCGLRGFFSRTG